VNVLVRGREYSYEFDVRFDANSFCVRFGMMIKSVVGVELGGVATNAVGDGIAHVPETTSYRVRIPFTARLTPGTYFGNAGVVGVADGAEIFLHRVTDVIVFRVAPEIDLRVTGAIDLSSPRECEVIEVKVEER
jgi:lipopolysaccharide transport system ATP-binding protein